MTTTTTTAAASALPPPVPRSSAAASSASPSSLDIWRKHQRLASAMREDPQMRAIVVVNPNEHYGPTPAAIGAAKSSEHSAHFQSYKTSMMLLPPGPEAWERLGKQTVLWKMGNCQQVMAAAFYRLKNDPEWSLPIDLTHVKGHHFLVAGRPAPAHVNDPANWDNAFVVDLWFQNMGRPGSGDAWPAPLERGLRLCKTYDWHIKMRASLVSDCRWERS